MIDTVVFDLVNTITHRSLKNGETVEQFEKQPYLKPLNNALMSAIMLDENKMVERTFEMLDETIVNNNRIETAYNRVERKSNFVFHNRVAMLNDKKDISFLRGFRYQKRLESSDYNINGRIPSAFDRIQFEFSIPKYLYSHSIAQFVPHTSSQRYKNNISIVHMLNFQLDLLLKRLSEFIIGFLHDFALNYKIDFYPDLEDIQIKRLDICYNQICVSKAHAFDKLEAQKKIYKTKLRSDSPVHKDEKTSLYYRKSDNTFFYKIYHKGSEFMKSKNSDFKRLMNFNKEFIEDNYCDELANQFLQIQKKYLEPKKKYDVSNSFAIYEYSIVNEINHKYVEAFEEIMPYKCYFLKNEADKIIRYEMQISDSYMSSIYKRKIFKANTKYDYYKKRYNRVLRYKSYLNEHRISTAQQYLKKHSLIKRDFEIYDILHRSILKKHNFFLSTSNNLKIHETKYNSGDVFYEKRGQKYYAKEFNEATLTKELLKEVVKLFIDETKHFQIKEFAELNTYIDFLDSYNKEAKLKKEIYILENGDLAYQDLKTSERKKLGLVQFNRRRFETIFKALDKGYSLDEIKQTMSKSTYYDLLNALKKFNIKQNTIKSQFCFKHDRLDFFHYYQLVNNPKSCEKLLSPFANNKKKKDTY